MLGNIESTTYTLSLGLKFLRLKYRHARRVQNGFVFCLLSGSNEMKQGG